MLDENTRAAIALKRFSIIAPVINKQVKNNIAYYMEIAKDPIDMPFYGSRKYSPKTLESWYCDYMREGSIDALKPSQRGDKGCFRKLTSELKEIIKETKLKNLRVPATVIYEMLVKSGDISPQSVSPSTVYRFLKNIAGTLKVKAPNEDREVKRFSHEYPNDLWQSDLMYGAYIKNGKEKSQTYLFAFIDDASRLITHAQFYFSQNFEILRHSFKEAVLRRGVPKIIYTDNGKIYRSQQFEWMCADIGCALVHSKPFVPKGRGKIERFFNTVRTRFLSTIDPTKIKDIDELNTLFWKWLEEDYQKKEHSSLDRLSPLDSFMLSVSKINLPDNPMKFNEKFYLRIHRKVIHDATFTVNKFLYETDSKFSNTRVEIRYEPEWIGVLGVPLLVYQDNKKVGEARLVNYLENANMKRRSNIGRKSDDGNGNISNKINFEETDVSDNISATTVNQTISFKDMV